MNAIARTAYTEPSFIKGISFGLRLPELKILVLIFVTLVSALSVVYIKDLNRRLFIAHQKLEIQAEQLRGENNKLLLEQSAWGAQARVQMVAQDKLQMKIPASADVIMIKV